MSGVFWVSSGFYSDPFQKTKFSSAFNPLIQESGAPYDFFRFCKISVRKSKNCQAYSITRGGLKFLDNRSIHVQFSRLI